MPENNNFIDVRKVISDKNPRLLKWMPDFLIGYIQKTLHEKEVNGFIKDNADKDSFEFCDEVVNTFNIQLSAFGIENIPETGGCVLAINHPLGGMDAMAIVTLLQQRRRDIKFIVNDVLLNLENLKDMFIGVNKHGKNAKASLKKVDDLFATDQLICVFPAGLVSRKKRGLIRDLEWKKTFITRSRKYKKPIIPVHINGELTNFFYRLSNLRTGLGIKANIEIFYLVDELFKQRNKKMNVIFGEPILSEKLDKAKSDLEWAQEIKKKVYQLAK